MKQKYNKMPYAVRLYEHTLINLNKVASNENMTVSDVIRLAINSMLIKMLNNKCYV
ncbi:MAG: RuvA C-terminal domain-containing protein [Methylococcales bacterium]